MQRTVLPRRACVSVAAGCKALDPPRLGRAVAGPPAAPLPFHHRMAATWGGAVGRHGLELGLGRLARLASRA